MTTQVALCVTCLVDQIYPEIGVATVTLLRKAGYGVAFPAAQTCCGQPFFNSGSREQAVELARRTIGIFEGYAYVVLPSGSCATMMKVEYGHLFPAGSEWHDRAVALAEKTFELTDFLVNVAGWEPSAVAQRGLTYHDSCHMCRLLGVRDEPRGVLNAAGYGIVEMAESDRCCGFGGLFSLKLPETAEAMTREKLRQAEETGVGLVATADPGCLMQMRRVAGAEGLGMRVEHVATLLAGGLDGE